jgi:hypothetical protein
MFHSPSKHKDFGVFLPVANGGWIISKTTPSSTASTSRTAPRRWPPTRSAWTS